MVRFQNQSESQEESQERKIVRSKESGKLARWLGMLMQAQPEVPKVRYLTKQKALFYLNGRSEG